MNDSPSAPTSESPASTNSEGVGIDYCQSLEDLGRQYNYLNFSSYARVFASLIIGEIKRAEKPVRVLDIGCGRGIGRQAEPQQEIHEAADEFWGIEPDESVVPGDDQFDNFQYALMETAELPENSFDIAYSSMVMEHVSDPQSFLTALHRALKPGGSYLFLTPNVHSFIPRVTKLCHDLRIDEFVLRMVQGQQQVEEYHYPVQFKCNSPKQISSEGERLGFLPPEFAYIEGSGGRSYFPGPLRLVYAALKAKRQLIKNPARLATMICKLTKAP